MHSLVLVNSANIAVNDTLLTTKLFGLHFCHRKNRSTFDEQTHLLSTDLGEYRPNVVVLAYDRSDIDGAEFGEAVEEYGDVGQPGGVELWKAEQIGRLDVAQSFLGVVDVLLQLVDQRCELVDGEVAATDVVVHRQRQPVHALRRRVHELVQVPQVASQDVNLITSSSNITTFIQFTLFYLV